MTREVVDQLHELLFTEAAQAPLSRSRGFATRRKHGNRSCAIGSERFQETKAVFLADAKGAGDGAADRPLGKKALEERGRGAGRERLRPEGERRRKQEAGWRRRIQDGLRVGEPVPRRATALDLPHPLGIEEDVETLTGLGDQLEDLSL
jgi:hypothetical protein